MEMGPVHNERLAVETPSATINFFFLSFSIRFVSINKKICNCCGFSLNDGIASKLEEWFWSLQGD